MQLWTIKSAEVWQILQRDKVLRATREHVIQSWQGDYNLPAHDWLRERMVERIGPPPVPNLYPMWAYFQFDDAKHRRPDIRRVRSWFSRGEHAVRLELRLEESRVLLSDMGGWYYLLGDSYFPLSVADAQAFEVANHTEDQRQQIKSESWERILDLDFHTSEPEISVPRDEKTIQATLWELRLEDVVGVREFVGCGNPTQFS